MIFYGERERPARSGAPGVGSEPHRLRRRVAVVGANGPDVHEPSAYAARSALRDLAPREQVANVANGVERATERGGEGFGGLVRELGDERDLVEGPVLAVLVRFGKGAKLGVGVADAGHFGVPSSCGVFVCPDELTVSHPRGFVH